MTFTYDPNSQEWDDGYDDDNYSVSGCDSPTDFDEHEMNPDDCGPKDIGLCTIED